MSSKQWLPAGNDETPYQRAQGEWDDRFGSLASQARHWRAAAIAELALLALAIAGAFYLGGQPKLVPHIIQIDGLGKATYSGPVTPEDYHPSELTLKYYLRRFVHMTRSISSDTQVVQRNLLEAYTLLTQQGANQLTAHIRDPKGDPFRRAADQRIGVEVLSVLPISKSSWQVDWRETEFDTDGNPTGNVQMWRGSFTLQIIPPTSAEALNTNPIGFFIQEFHWDQVQG